MQGIGRELIKSFEQALLEWHIENYRVATNAADINSNAFYWKTGFTPYGQIKYNDLRLQIYQKKIIQ